MVYQDQRCQKANDVNVEEMDKIQEGMVSNDKLKNQACPRNECDKRLK